MIGHSLGRMGSNHYESYMIGHSLGRMGSNHYESYMIGHSLGRMGEILGKKAPYKLVFVEQKIRKVKKFWDELFDVPVINACKRNVA